MNVHLRKESWDNIFVNSLGRVRCSDRGGCQGELLYAPHEVKFI